jgi:signal transduction histidine kinase/DNA-binding NarL/FixJ family response regulator
MHTVLVLTYQPTFASGIVAVLDPARWRVLSHEDAASAAQIAARQAVDAVILDVDLNNAQILDAVKVVRDRVSTVPLIVYSAEGHCHWEEEAYLMGVSHVLEKPVRGRLLNHLLEKLLGGGSMSGELVPVGPRLPMLAPTHQIAPVAAQPHPLRQLDNLRRFSSLLVHSLDAKSLLQHALQQVREALGVNRVAVFLRKPDGINTDGAPSADDQWLRAMQSVGHEPSILKHFALSLASGLGAHLHRNSRILRTSSHEAMASREIMREFEILGSSIAVPIMERDTFVGILLLDERITGGTFSDDELLHLFHWLEELGTALRNCWRHEQLMAGHGLIDEIIASLGSGCVVVGSNRGIIHANSAALGILFPDGSRQSSRKTFDFADLPQQLGSQVFQVIQSGQPAAPFKWTPPHRPELVVGVRITPFSVSTAQRADAALLVLDDITEHERAVQLEVEANKLRLVRQMAWHLAHEIGNALTPISTLQQIVEEDMVDAEQRKELAAEAGKSMRRIQRLTQQMNFLSREWDGKGGETVKVAELLSSAYNEAYVFHPGKRTASLEIDRSSPATVTGDTKALRHAFSEIILNALQANPEKPTVTVRIQPARDGSLAVEVEDAGPGFPSDVADGIGVPFQSTRSVGLGLGLTVTRKIIENHLGKIEIAHTGKKGPGIIRVTLPNSHA